MRDESITQSILHSCGAYEPHITRLLESTLRAGDTFIDVGANFGYMTLLGSSLVGDAGRVISFEPLSVNADYCQQNIELNNVKNVSLLRYGLWSERKVMRVTGPDTFLGGAHLMNGATPAEVIVEETVCLTLDAALNDLHTHLDNLRLIKIDIEGAEPFALDGMAETLRNVKPIIVLEVNRHCLRGFWGVDSDAIWERLSSLDYDVLAFPEQVESSDKLPLVNMFGNMDLLSVHNAETLASICPPDGLIDIVAVPRR